MSNAPKAPSDVARTMGPADQNESVPASDRTGDSKSPLSNGPKITASGSYMPAKYDLGNGLIREDR